METIRTVKLYFRHEKAEGWLHITPDGEVEIAICAVGQYRKINFVKGGHLEGAQKAVSMTLLKQIGRVIVDLSSTKRLWWDSTDSRRARVYTCAFQRLGLEIETRGLISVLGNYSYS